MDNQDRKRRYRGSYLPEHVAQERWGLLGPTLLAALALAVIAYVVFK